MNGLSRGVLEILLLAFFFLIYMFRIRRADCSDDSDPIEFEFFGDDDGINEYNDDEERIEPADEDEQEEVAEPEKPSEQEELEKPLEQDEPADEDEPAEEADDSIIESELIEEFNLTKIIDPEKFFAFAGSKFKAIESDDFIVGKEACLKSENKRKIRNLYECCQVPEIEEALMLFDESFLSNGKSGFVITKSGIYGKNEKMQKHYSWEEFANLDIFICDEDEFYVGPLAFVYVDDEIELYIETLKILQKAIKVQGACLA